MFPIAAPLRALLAAALTLQLGGAQIAVTTVAGSGLAAFADGVGSGASFNVPFGVAVTPGGDLVVGDRYSHRVRVVTPDGVVGTLAGSGTAGDTDGVGAGASFNELHGVAVHASGSVVVADTFNHKIRSVAPNGVVTTLAGSGAPGFADGLGAGAVFSAPTGVAVASSGTM